MYQTVSRFSKALGFLLLVVTASGCIDHTYDLEKLDRNVHIGQGDYSLPLGTTDKFTVGDLVGDSFDELISRNSDGTYSWNNTEADWKSALSNTHIINRKDVPSLK